MKNLILWAVVMVGYLAYICPVLEDSRWVRFILNAVIATCIGYGFGCALTEVIGK